MPTYLSKICSECGSTFDCEPHWNKDYCDTRCRLTAKRKREKQRAKNRATNTIRKPEVIYDPTERQLESFAATVLSSGQQQIFGGHVPMWTPPKGVLFERWALDESKWLLFNPDMEPQEFDPSVIKQDAEARAILDKLSRK